MFLNGQFILSKYTSNYYRNLQGRVTKIAILLTASKFMYLFYLPASCFMQKSSMNISLKEFSKL